MDRPMIYPRREVKVHGTRRAVEGAFSAGETALLVDDLITRGHSKLEAIESLEAAGLAVRDVLVLIDREQGGEDDLTSRGYRLHAALKLTRLLAALRASDRMSQEEHEAILAYLERT
jgi:uridine monophosphate synthetase